MSKTYRFIQANLNGALIFADTSNPEIRFGTSKKLLQPKDLPFGVHKDVYFLNEPQKAEIGDCGPCSGVSYTESVRIEFSGKAGASGRLERLKRLVAIIESEYGTLQQEGFPPVSNNVYNVTAPA